VAKGLARTVPASRYGTAISVMAAMGWGWEEYRAAPTDLVDEVMELLTARDRVANEARKRSEQRGKHGGRS